MSNSNQLNEILKYLAQFHPMAGTIEMYAGQEAPSGWLICDGSAINRTEYSKLFEVIGQTYGAGDGNTTFNLPDMRGRTPIGVGTGTYTGATAHALGVTGGAESISYTPAGTVANHTLTVAQMPAHVHSIVKWNKGTNTVAASAGWFQTNFSSGSSWQGISGYDSSRLFDAGTSSTGGNGAHNHGWTGTAATLSQMQPYIAITYIISTGQVEYPEIEQEENNG